MVAPNHADMLVQLNLWRALPAETKWLEFKAAREHFDADELGRYVSAMANEANLSGRAEGWLVFGVADKRDATTGLRPVCGSRYALDAGYRNTLKHRLAVGTSPALSLPDPLELKPSDCPAGTRVLLWRIPAAPAGLPVAWQGHYYGRDGEALGALAIHEFETIRAQAALRDWSAVSCEGAWHLLDSAALRRARELYRRRHASHAQVLEKFEGWGDREFLHRLRLATGGRVTRAGLLLLGQVLKRLATGPQPREKINALLLRKLPGHLTSDAERKDYVRRLIQEMREAGLIVNVGKATRGALWALPP